MKEFRYCIGNGKIAAYTKDGDWEQVFGPPYSSPAVFALKNITENIQHDISRIPHTAVWWNHIKFQSGHSAEVLDFALQDTPCICRTIETEEAISFTLDRNTEISGYDRVVENTQQISGAVWASVVKINGGNAFYSNYPSAEEQYFQLFVSGDIKVTQQNNSYVITALPGKSRIMIIGGPSYPDMVKNTENSMLSDPYNDTKKYWRDFFDGHSPESLLKGNPPEKELLIKVIESTMINIKSQQSIQGGVLAGSCYKMAYVRDQYGVYRALLAMKCFDEAKAILLFYKRIFEENGRIKNAQAMGVRGQFHHAENDESEITGYLLLSLRDWFSETKNSSLILEMKELAAWAVDCQLKNTVGGMLPFNGDETYIAGHILPRTAINDGSAEATLLFILGGRFVLEFPAPLLSPDMLSKLEKTLKNIESTYALNFTINGQYVSNNPKRREIAPLPDFRFGVCQGSSEAECMFFSWTQKNKDGMYLCPSCYAKNITPPDDKEIYQIKTAALMPYYLKDTFLPKELIDMTISEICGEFKKTGMMPSRPGSNVNTGYDFGLLLYSLTCQNRKNDALILYNKTLEMLDDSISWSEYYIEGEPAGVRYRPWESGINTEALINFANNL